MLFCKNSLSHYSQHYLVAQVSGIPFSDSWGTFFVNTDEGVALTLPHSLKCFCRSMMLNINRPHAMKLRASSNNMLAKVGRVEMSRFISCLLEPVTQCQFLS